MEVWDLLVGLRIWVLLYEDSRMRCLRELGSGA